MKRLLCCLFLSSLTLPGFGQNNGVVEIPEKEYYRANKMKVSSTNAKISANPAATGDTVPITNHINRGIAFGVSLGFNSVFQSLYEARISPLDNTLKITGVPTVAFLLSTGVSVSPSGYKCKLGGRYYRKLNSDDSKGNTAYYVPYGLCALATVNLATFNSAASG